jgi:hypothetical protein
MFFYDPVVLGEMVSNWGGDILPEIQRAFEQSPEWKEYEDILLTLTETEVDPGTEGYRLETSISESSTEGRKELGWENIEISFISDDRVQVKIGSQVETRNYAEMGFEDKRSGKPNHAWGVLRALARNGGVIPNSVRTRRCLS